MRYKDVKVYKFKDKLYLCRGVAAEQDHDGSGITQTRLLYPGTRQGILDEAIAKGAKVSVFRFIGSGKDKSSYFMSKQDLLKSPVVTDFVKSHDDLGSLDQYICSCQLDTTVIQPIRFPLMIDIETTRDGRFCAYINLHPELNGRNAPGLPCFPNWDFIDVYAGKAVITEVKEKNSYGFFKGAMIQFGMVNMSDFLDYVWEHGFDEDPVYIVNHPTLGQFLCSDSYVWVETATSPMFKGSIPKADYEKVEWKKPKGFDQYVVRIATIKELLLEDAFGGGVTEQSLINRFGECAGLTRRFSERWTISKSLLPDIVHQGIAEGLLYHYCLVSCHIHALKIDPSMAYRLAAFSAEEVEEMAAEVSKINAGADRAIGGCLKKGKLQLA